MTNLVFLEAATQSDSAAEIIESNEALINFATAEVDSLVEEQALHISRNINLFIESNAEITNSNISSSIEDIVSLSSAIFSEIIASDLSDDEKRISIEGYSHIISMGDYDLIEEFISKKAIGGMVVGAAGGAIGGKLGSKLGGMTAKLSGSYFKLKKLITQETDIRNKMKNNSSPKLKSELSRIIKEKEAAKIKYEEVKAKRSSIGSAVGGTVGGVAAGAAYDAKTGKGGFKSHLKSGAIGVAAGAIAGKAGSIVGGAVAMFSKQRKVWKGLVAQEKNLLSKSNKNTADRKSLAKISKEKEIARAEYNSIRDKAKGLGSMAGGLIGAGAVTKGIGRFV